MPRRITKSLIHKTTSLGGNIGDAPGAELGLVELLRARLGQLDGGIGHAELGQVDG